MKFGIRFLLILTVAIAAVFAWMQWQTDRKKRIQIACDKLQVASDNQFDPVEISNAFRYLKSIGVHETVLALNQLESHSKTSIQRRLICSRLPFLFDPGPGMPQNETNVFYSGGLIFGGYSGGPMSQQSGLSKHQIEMTERYVNLQASVILEVEDHHIFFRRNSVKWNAESEQFDNCSVFGKKVDD